MYPYNLEGPRRRPACSSTGGVEHLAKNYKLQGLQNQNHSQSKQTRPTHQRSAKPRPARPKPKAEPKAKHSSKPRKQSPKAQGKIEGAHLERLETKRQELARFRAKPKLKTETKRHIAVETLLREHGRAELHRATRSPSLPVLGTKGLASAEHVRLRRTLIISINIYNIVHNKTRTSLCTH